MPVADLHVHTTVSDGQLSPATVSTAAAAAGLEAVAITDHDAIHPTFDKPVVIQDEIEVIHGIELRIAAEDLRVDLLGYGVDPTPALRTECDRLATDRKRRAQAIIDCLEDRLDIALDLSPFDGIGRPHIARAIGNHPDVTMTADETFNGLIGSGDPCYRPRELPSFDHGRALLADASAIVGLAHPFRYDDPMAALDLTKRLDAVEYHYPYDRAVDTALLNQVIDQYDLLPLGGSDAHDETVGITGLNRAEYDRFRGQLPA